MPYGVIAIKTIAAVLYAVLCPDLDSAHVLLESPEGTPAPWTLPVQTGVARAFGTAGLRGVRPETPDAARRLWRELAGLPPLHDAWRFPPAAWYPLVKSRCRSLAWEYRTRARLELDRAAALCEAAAELDLIWAAYDAAEDAQNPRRTDLDRRRCLRRVKELIGEEAYLKGELPSITAG